MKLQGLTELLTEAVGIPSVNPAHSQDVGITHEARFADWLAAQLSARGLQVETLPLMGPDRPAVIGRAGPTNGHQLMFGVHLDTVGVDQMTVDPFQITERDGKLYGRGTSDMKGSTVALLHALTPERVSALAERGVGLTVIGTPDEECGTGGAIKLSKTEMRFDHAVILEPTLCKPVVAHKGAHWIDLTLKGRGGHGSQPDAGVNTHHALAELLPRLFALQRELEAAYSHPLLGHSTLNIGRIMGGDAYNMIADETTLHMDRRIVPNEPPEAFDDRAAQILNDLCAEGLLLDGSVKVAAHTQPFSTDPDSALVQHLQQTVEAVTHHHPAPYGTSWVSDASPFSLISESIVVFGPGDIAQAHTADEYIEREQLETGSAIFVHFLDHYAAGAS